MRLSPSSRDKKQANELLSKENVKSNGRNVLPKPDLIDNLSKGTTVSKKPFRSASMRVSNKTSSATSSSSSMTSEGEKMTNGIHTKIKSTKVTSQILAKKVTFKSNLEEDREVHDVLTTSANKMHPNVSISAAKTSNSIKIGSPTLAKRSSSLPR